MMQFKGLRVLLGIVFFMQNAVSCMSSSTTSTTTRTTTMDNPTTSATLPTTTSQTSTPITTTSQPPTPTTTTSQTPTTTTIINQAPTTQETTTNFITSQVPSTSTTTSEVSSSTSIASPTSSTFSASSDTPSTTSTTSHIFTTTATTTEEPTTTMTASEVSSTSSNTSEVSSTVSTTSPATTTTSSTSQASSTTLTTSPAFSTTSTTSPASSTISTTSPASSTISTTSPASSTTSTTSPASITTSTSPAPSVTSTTSSTSSKASTTSPASTTTSSTSQASSTTLTTSSVSSSTSTTSAAFSTISTTSPAFSTTSTTSPSSSTISTASPTSSTTSTTSSTSPTTSATSPAPSTTSTTSSTSSTIQTTSPASSTTSTTSPASTMNPSTSQESSSTSTTSAASSSTSTTSAASSTISTTSPAFSTTSTTSPASSTNATTSPSSSTISTTSPTSSTTSTTSSTSPTTSATSPAPSITSTTNAASSTSSTTSPESSTTSTTSPASSTTSSTSQESSSTTSAASSSTLTTSAASSTISTTSPAFSTTSATSPASSTNATTSLSSSTISTTSLTSSTTLTTSSTSPTTSATSPAASITSTISSTSSTISTTTPAFSTTSTSSPVSTTTSSTSQESSSTSTTSAASSSTLTTSAASSTISTTSPAFSTTSTTSPASSTNATTSPSSSTISTTSPTSSTTSATSPATSTTSTTSPASSSTSTTDPASTTNAASSTSSTTSPESSTTSTSSPASSTISTSSPASSTTSSTSAASSTISTTSAASPTTSTTNPASFTTSTSSPASSTISTSSPASSTTSTTSPASSTTSTSSLASSTTSTTSAVSSTTSTTSPAYSTASTSSSASSTISIASPASSTTSTTSPEYSTTPTTSSASSTTSTTIPAPSSTSTLSPAFSTTSTSSPAPSTTSTTSPLSSTTSTTSTASSTTSNTSPTSTTTSVSSPGSSTTSTPSPASSTTTSSPASTTISTTSPESSSTSSTSLPTSTTSTSSQTSSMTPTTSSTTTSSPASTTTSTTSPASSTTSTTSPASSTTTSSLASTTTSTVTTSQASSTTSTTNAASNTVSTSSQTSSTTSSSSEASSTNSTTSPESTITSTTSTSTADSTTSSLPSTSTVITTVPTKCGFPYSYGPSTDVTMPIADEWCRGRIRPNFRVPFRGQKYRKIFVCPNGIVCFGKRLQTYFIPRNGEFRYSFLGRSCLAPYFSDLATYWGGNIYYRYIDALVDTTAPEIDVARDIVQRSQGLNIQPTFILITTWDRVPHYYAYFYLYYRGISISVRTVTFQVVYITDGKKSYSFYYYEEGGMNIPYGRVFIGLIEDGRANGFTNSRDGSFLRQPDKNLFSGDCYGQYEYIDSESDDIDSELVCRQWHSRELNNLETYNFYLNRMPDCPCFSWFLFFDRRFFFPWWLSGSGSTFTAYVRPSRRFSPYGKTCEYRRFRGTFIRRGKSAGSFTRYHPWTHSQLHYSEDVYYKQMCCEEADLCDLYFEVRPRHTCYRRFPFRFSWAFGDPHITTLDNRTYTFNGHDEYILLNVTTETFQIQCRTDRGFRADGNTSLATVFTAFVVSGDGVWMQAELNANRTGLIVYAGENKTSFDDYTDAFNNDSLSVSDIDLSEKLTLDRSGDTLMSTFVELGISFNVTLGKKLLQLGIGLPENLNNQTEGLLGNFNDNPDDDFIPRFADQPLAYNSTERTIFEQFGQTWKTTQEESKFKYDDGKTRSNYSTDFIPNFIEEADPVLVQQAEEKCGQGKAQCIFDFVFTGDEEIADSTLSTQTTADVVTEVASNEVPGITIQSGLNLINGQGYLYTNLKEYSSFNVLGEDDGVFSYEIVSNSSFASLNTETNNSATVTVYLNSTEPRNLSITVVDNQNVYADAIDVIIVVCTGCSEHGSCDFTTFRQDNDTTETFKIATCNCLEYWEGDDCEIDYDGCQDDPCAVGRNCTDKNATFHQAEEQEQNDTNPYTCGGCPLGYLIDPDEKCEDIDECNSTNGNCSQTCTNTEGSFSCSCSSTYRLGFDGQTCDDINECEEATSGCDQICNNTVGGFECLCHEGYIYNTSTSSCEQTNSLQTQCSMIDCSNAHGCTLNSTSDAVCFCNNGFELQNDGSCADIDECAQNVCSQGCTNTQGSYNCTCYAGFMLSSDKISCEECDFPNYGENCASKCQCGRGNDGCDNVRGCICKTGWTGANCDTDIDECVDPNICGDINKVCANTVGSYTCNCRSGYSLQTNGTCSDTDECTIASLNTCAQQCINTIGGFVCGCRDGYSLDENNSTQCLEIDECASGVSACEQTCINTKGSYRCECYLGFVLSDDRKKCTKESDPCTLFPEIQCSDICRVVDQQPICLCNVGFELGADNQTCIDINECDSSLDLNKCTEKDTCVNIRGKYECSCSLGYQLGKDQRTCTECDEFHWGENCDNDCNCGVGATSCDPKVGCVCENGWSGVLCDIDRNECASSPNPCSGDNEQCTNTPGSYVCSCVAGYERSTNGNCENVNECETASLNQCDQLCTDTVGSYTCSCRPGFTQNGTSCADIDECAGQHGCSQVCSNTQGSYRCTCKEGFKLELSDRRTCIPSSTCQDETFCGNNAVCTSIDGVDTCDCNKGYEFAENSNTTCIDIQECSINPEQCSQACVEQDGGYECVCNESGYKLDVDLSSCKVCDYGSYGDNCTSNCSCVESKTARCDNINGVCTCQNGWTGDTCDTDVNECETINVCPLNSSCLNSMGSYICQCDPGFLTTSDGQCQSCTGFKYGTDCSEECTCDVVNTERCDPVYGNCTCKAGWIGTNCTDDMNECVNSTICGDELKMCVNTNGSFVCNCIMGYIKSTDGSCEDVDECAEGQGNCTFECTNTNGSFRCDCPQGQSGSGSNCTDCADNNFGTNCSTTCGCIPEHSVNPNQTCNPVDGVCDCLSTWTGVLCETDVDECADNSTCNITNGGCHNVDGGFECSCFIGYANQSNQCVLLGNVTTTTTTPVPNEDGDRSVSIYVVLSYSLPQTRNLRIQATYNYYVTEVETAIFRLFSATLGENLKSVVIIFLQAGSLVVNSTVTYADTDAAGSQFTEVVYSLATNQSLTLLNETVYPQSLIVGNNEVTINDPPTRCELFEEVHGCQSDLECTETGGTVSCQSDSSSDNTVLIIGLSVGLSVFLLTVLSVVLVLILSPGKKIWPFGKVHSRIYR